MRKKLFLLSIVFFSTLIFCGSCKKNKTSTLIEDPHNHSLLKKSLEEIRTEISGKWQVQYRLSYGFTGIQKYTPPSGQGELFFFFANDTVRQSTYDLSIILLNDKASIVKASTSAYNGELVYNYNFTVPFNRTLVMQEIKNDTLIVDEGFASGGGRNYYLIRKQ